MCVCVVVVVVMMVRVCVCVCWQWVLHETDRMGLNRMGLSAWGGTAWDYPHAQLQILTHCNSGVIGCCGRNALVTLAPRVGGGGRTKRQAGGRRTSKGRFYEPGASPRQSAAPPCPPRPPRDQQGGGRVHGGHWNNMQVGTNGSSQLNFGK